MLNEPVFRREMQTKYPGVVEHVQPMYIYTENSHEPLARVDSVEQHAEVYWHHTELNGLPEKVTDSSGDVVWQGVSTTWGRSVRETARVGWDVPQNLCVSRGSIWTGRRACITTPFAIMTPAAGATRRWTRLGCSVG